LSRMAECQNVTVLAKELGIRRGSVHVQFLLGFARTLAAEGYALAFGPYVGQLEQTPFSGR
jgi:hypothetical protein